MTIAILCLRRYLNGKNLQTSVWFMVAHLFSKQVEQRQTFNKFITDILVVNDMGDSILIIVIGNDIKFSSSIQNLSN